MDFCYWLFKEATSIVFVAPFLVAQIFSRASLLFSRLSIFSLPRVKSIMSVEMLPSAKNPGGSVFSV